MSVARVIVELFDHAAPVPSGAVAMFRRFYMFGIRTRTRRFAVTGGAVIATLAAVYGSAGAAQASPAPDEGVTRVMVAPAPARVKVAPAPKLNTPEYARWYAKAQMAHFGWKTSEMKCLVPMWIGESHWDIHEETGPYIGIPQTTPGVVNDYGFSESQYRESADVQVTVGLRYIKERYGSPCAAWEFWKAQGAWQDSADPNQWWGGWY